MFKKICIIGCGLIGSSIARAVKKNNLRQTIFKLIQNRCKTHEEKKCSKKIILLIIQLTELLNIQKKIKTSLRIFKDKKSKYCK